MTMKWYTYCISLHDHEMAYLLHLSAWPWNGTLTASLCMTMRWHTYCVSLHDQEMAYLLHLSAWPWNGILTASLCMTMKRHTYWISLHDYEMAHLLHLSAWPWKGILTFCIKILIKIRKALVRNQETLSGKYDFLEYIIIILGYFPKIQNRQTNRLACVNLWRSWFFLADVQND